MGIDGKDDSKAKRDRGSEEEMGGKMEMLPPLGWNPGYNTVFDAGTAVKKSFEKMER